MCSDFENVLRFKKRRMWDKGIYIILNKVLTQACDLVTIKVLYTIGVISFL